MSEIPKNYEPCILEERWYRFWLLEGCFQADPRSSKPPYSIVIPPPNVTGVLTLGHVLNITIQDILARRARMHGKEVLWLPGTDHAGIATQNVVEKTLRKEGAIKHRNDLGREGLVGRIWEWKEKYGGLIIAQLQKLGASCDWSRERFTMDPDYSRRVQDVFVDLFKKGLIYRGKRMVNWDPSALTALSDEEVEMKPQNGTLYYFHVEVREIPGTFLTIATTRPETIPGDTAIAVNPQDPRYARFIGLSVTRPLPAESASVIPIIGDEHVDFEFGTGVLKVTPAHDKADFDIGQRHGLPVLEVMEPNGTMNALAGRELAGLDRFAAREAAVAKLRDLGALVREEPYQNNVGYSERAQVPIEPRLSEQWFLRYPSRERAAKAVASGAIRFHPERWTKVYSHWMANLQDWCISRQLWWGHRVPFWSKRFEDRAAAASGVRAFEEILLSDGHSAVSLNGQPAVPEEAPGGFSAPGEVQAGIATTNTALISALEKEGWEQDPDVLDTWFSSWLWPFATMGWPDSTETLAKFYPTTDLVTGPDIIFFWVARMIMAGFEYAGEPPFQNVYFTGIIRDKEGRKMSKSLGNSPDPLELISKYSADALRFGVMRSAPLGQDVLFDEKNVELGRNFCTKVWNACRFRQMQGGLTEGEIAAELLTSDDKWILSRLDQTITEVSQALDGYLFAEAAAGLQRFFWNEFCDWYLEAAKAALGGAEKVAADPRALARKANTLAVIDFVLGHALRLLHPFLPFLTEELWHGMGFQRDLPEGQGGKTIMFARWPKPLGAEFLEHYGIDPDAIALTGAKQATVEAGRALRRDMKIAGNKRLRFLLRTEALLDCHDAEVVRVLLNAETLELIDAAWSAPKGTPVALTPLGELFLPTAGLADPAAERERLAREATKVELELAKVRAKLADENFTAKVPAAVLAEHRQREATWSDKLSHLRKMELALLDL